MRWKGLIDRMEEGLGFDGRTISEWIFKKIGINMRKWVDSAQDEDYWSVIGNATLNLRVP